MVLLVLSVSEVKKHKASVKAVKIPLEIYEKYFNGSKADAVTEIIVRELFSTADLKALNTKYFFIIAVDDYDVIFMSRNTGHVWYIYNLEYPKPRSRIIFHKHSVSHVYHQHGKANTIWKIVGVSKSMIGNR